MGEQAEAPIESFQAAVFHDGTTETLIWQVGVEADAKKLAWIVPVPTPPDDYDVVPENMFNVVGKFVGVTEVTKARMRGRTGSASVKPVIEMPNANAGPYTFQSVAIQGEAGVEALNKWLEVKGFQAIDADRLAYYAERNWTFLVVRLDAREGNLGAGDLPPIKIRFKTPVPVVPFKLAASSIKMPSRVYVFSAAEYSESVFSTAVKRLGFKLPLDPRKGPEWKLGAEGMIAGRMSFYVSNAPNSIKTVFEDVFGDTAKRGHVYTLLHDGLTQKSVNRWKEDFFIGPPNTRLAYAIEDAEATLPPSKTIGSVQPQKDDRPDMGTVGGDDLSELETPEQEDDLDYTMIVGVVALVFCVVAVGGIQLRRMR